MPHFQFEGSKVRLFLEKTVGLNPFFRKIHFIPVKKSQNKSGINPLYNSISVIKRAYKENKIKNSDSDN